MQALQQHRRKQEALHKELCAQRDQLLQTTSGRAPLQRQSSSADTATATTLPPPALMQSTTSLAGCMPPLPSLPAAMLNSTGGGSRSLHEAVGALPGQELPLPCLPLLPSGPGLLQDEFKCHIASMPHGKQQEPSVIPPLLAISATEWPDGRRAVNQPAHGVVSDTLPLQHGSYANCEDQVMQAARGSRCLEAGSSAC
jgi:hypothetical protein